ncbi:hypothetical protein OG339_27660 [Streptosporangium sp. NBC_01495]|uniref:hypothetical protein n=1 Tax=Streptosporangium sp. NBC_01495 TaxID=2903899 RepID=UPI002E361888|nr:hypothetical protein [Streptosporangium sp. NBC_01495]
MKPFHGVRVALALTATCAAAVLISQAVRVPSSVPASCPERWGGDGPGGWVPAATDLDGAGESLVPGEPLSAMICAYPGDSTRPGGERLAGSRILTGEAGAIAHDLGYLPVTTDDPGGPCTQAGGAMTNYLIRFAYPRGEALWVGSAEEVNSCVTTTNGTVGTRSYVGRDITVAYRTGTWSPVRPDDPCHGPTGRRGQNERMVPGEPVSVLVCGQPTSYDGRSPRLEHGRQTAEALAATLNSLDTWTSEKVCRRTGGTRDGDLRVLFGYPDGPPADVRVSPSCDPGVDNGLLQADLGETVRDQVARLAPPS